MQVVRLYDGRREPRNWLKIIQPSEVAVFVTLADSGAACDAEGTPTGADDAVCIIFKTLSEAEAYCRERVERNPALRFEVMDSGGRLRPPLLTVVHSSRVESLDGSPSKMRFNKRAAIALLALGPLMIWFDWMFYGGDMIMPTVVGINFVLIGVRLLVMNRGHVAAEQARLARVAALRDG